MKNYSIGKGNDFDDDEQLIGDVSPVEKMEDADEALRIVQAGVAPYTVEDEKKVIKKIDGRLLWVMLV